MREIINKNMMSPSKVRQDLMIDICRRGQKQKYKVSVQNVLDIGPIFGHDKNTKHIKFNFFILICNMLLQNEGGGGQGSFAVATEIYPKIETALGPSFVCQFKWIIRYMINCFRKLSTKHNFRFIR